MFLLGAKLGDHGLYDTNVSVQESTDSTSGQGDPNVGGKANQDQAEHCADTSHQENWLPANTIGEATPVHSHGGFS